MSVLEDMVLAHKITKQDAVSIVYKGRCLWLENTKTVARFMYVKGRLLIQVPVDDEVTWNYWHMDEFLNEWDLINLQPV